MVERLFLGVPRGCLRFVIAVFPKHTHLLFINRNKQKHHKSNQIQHVNKATDQQTKPVISHRPAASKTLLKGS